MTDEVELLSQGAEPRRAPTELARGTRAVAGLALVGALAGSYLLWGRDSTSGSSASSTTTQVRTGRTFAPPPPLAPRLHQVRVSTTQQSAQVTSRGHVELDLDLVNDGGFALGLLAVDVPQAGVKTVVATRGPVTYRQIAELRPGTATAITLQLRLLCPQSAAGPAADHDVADQQEGARVDLAFEQLGDQTSVFRLGQDLLNRQHGLHPRRNSGSRPGCPALF